MKAKSLSRRDLLKAMTTVGTLTALQGLWPRWLPRLAFTNDGVAGDVIVCIFLRGGADALNMIVPFGDSAYYQARPTLALAPPDSNTSDRLLALDDFFGLNPDMVALHELFTSGRLTAIHAVGAPHISRSHFEAMDVIESGVDGENGANTGWLGRHLQATAAPVDSPLRAIGWDDKVPKSLQGYVSANALRSITDYHLAGDDTRSRQMASTLAAMYATSSLDNAAQATLKTLATVNKINIDAYIPAHGAAYSETDFGRALKQTAALIKADAGLEVACIDLGNFDTHVTQGSTTQQGIGILPTLVREFAVNLRAFHDDLQAYMGRVTVVAMSEFGRRAQENGAAGTDHGHGGAMYVLSEHVQPVPVHAEWPGLNHHFLDNGDLAITVDYRTVLSEILLKRTPRTDLHVVFPGFDASSIGILA